jgi:hypothetical protein
MLKSTLLVLLVVAARPSRSDACIHEVERVVESETSVLARAEKALEGGNYATARRIVETHTIGDTRLKLRAQDVVAVANLRVPKRKADVAKALKHFEARSASDAGKKDVRFRAWLAEAYVAAGRKDDARAILVELDRRDLMPDEYAYLALAKVSSSGERFAAWQACRTRAQNKTVCELPHEVVVASTNTRS